MNGTTMQGGCRPAAQAAQVIVFNGGRESAAHPEPFTDNLDHLQALEQEAKLMLALASMQRCQQRSGLSEDPWGECRQFFPFLPPEATLKEVAELLIFAAAENRLREEESLRLGRTLNFCAFCLERRLEPFERDALLLLLMNFTAPSFASIFSRCSFDAERCNGGMEIGSLLGIICDNFRAQLESRRYFSVNATLMKEEILVLLGHVGDTDNILNETVYLHERIARFIVGDNNQYSTAFRYIRRERCAVSLDQVILPGELKKEALTLVERYLSSRASGALNDLDSFFGYGTALVLMFHGPSGTGKTMLARALASRCDRELISLNVSDLDEIPLCTDDILAGLFREASLQNSIVLLDECDDLFVNNSFASRSLLIEIERARCVVILATNKPVDLDPAMERRISRKISFQLPGPELRLRMWQSLLPASVRVAPDVDLAELAERFNFSGGLIKNAVMMAISLCMNDPAQTSSLAGDSPLIVTRAALERGASLQSDQLTDLSGVCRVYKPLGSIDTLPILPRQREELRNTALAWKQLRAEGLGLNVLVTSASIQTGVELAEALAAQCRLKVRSFELDPLLARSESELVIHPVTQRKVTPLHYAFSGGPGDASLTLIIDYEGDMASVIEEQFDPAKNYKAVLLKELFAHLRGHLGLLCLVTRRPLYGIPPFEFNLGFDLEYPSEQSQVTFWQERLAAGTSLASLHDLVTRFPMHQAEIDYHCRQAAIQTIIRGGSGRPDLAAVLEVIGRYRQKTEVPLLFGREASCRSTLT